MNYANNVREPAKRSTKANDNQQVQASASGIKTGQLCSARPKSYT